MIKLFLAAQTQYDFSLDDININCLKEHIMDSQQAIDYRGDRGSNRRHNYWGVTGVTTTTKSGKVS